MNKLIFTGISEPNVLQPITSASFDFLQWSISAQDAALAQAGYGPHQSTLSAKFLGTGGRIQSGNFQGGFFYGGAFMPELYYVEPCNGATSFVNPPVIKPSHGWATSGGSWPNIVQADPVTFTDGVARNVHSIQRWVMVDEVLGSSGGYYSNFLHGGTSATTIVATGSWTGSTYALLNNDTGVVTFQALGGIASILTGTATLGTLPVGYRPTTAKSIPVTVLDDSTYKAGVLTVSTAGVVTVVGTYTGTLNRGVYLDGVSIYIG